MCQVLFGARQEIVDSDHGVALRQQAVAHVRPNESGGAGYQNPQTETLLIETTAGFRGPLCYIQRLPHGPPILAGNRAPGDPVMHLRIPFLAAFPQAGGCHPPVPRQSRFQAPSARAAHPPIRLGSDAARQGDPRTAPARHRARLRVLGLLRFRADHAQPLGGGFRPCLPQPRQASSGELYFAFVAVFAVAVAISIAGLAIRRFVAQPKWLGKVAPESGIIALLILHADGHLSGRVGPR